MSQKLKILWGVIGVVVLLSVGWWFIDGQYRFQDREVSQEERAFRDAVMQELEVMEEADTEGEVEDEAIEEEAPSEDDEQETATQGPVELQSGSFTQIDAVHKGSGEARIVQTSQGEALILSDDFKVTNGPDLYVYLSKNTDIDSSSELGEYTSLGLLESIEGRQVYSLPDDYDQYNSVVIWCKAYGVLFSSATLN